MTNNIFNAEIQLEKDPIVREKITPPDIEVLLARKNGWRKVHMKQIKKDDPFRKKLFLNNPDGMYYVDKDGYYVTPEKWEAAKRELYTQINYENPLKSNIIDIDRIYTMKLGGTILKFQNSGKFETASPIQSNIPTTYAEMYGVQPEINPNLPLNHQYNIHNAIALQNGWIKVKVKHIDLDANRKWEHIIRQKNPEDFYIVDPNTREIIPESTFAKYMPKMGSEEIDQNRAEFEVQQAANHRDLQQRDPQGLAVATIMGGASTIPGIGIPMLFAGHEAGEAGHSYQNNDYWGVVAHTLAGALPYSGKLVRGAYEVVGKTVPKIVSRYVGPLLFGTALSAAQTKSEARKLENIPVISDEFLRRENYTQEDIHNELRRLNYTLTSSGNNDATQYTVKGNLGKDNGKSDRNLAFDIGTAATGHVVNGLATGALLNPKFRSWVVKFLSNLKGLTKILGYGVAGLLTQMPALLYDIYLWNQYPHDSNNAEQSTGERAYILINYLNNMASDTKGYNPHAVFPSTFTDEQKSGQVYTGQEVPDSIPLMLNGEVEDTTYNSTESADNDSAWYNKPKQ